MRRILVSQDQLEDVCHRKEGLGSTAKERKDRERGRKSISRKLETKNELNIRYDIQARKS